MFKTILFLVIIILFFLKYKYKIKINLPSFFHKGIKLKGGKYGIYCYCGKQGSSKTASVIRYLYEHSQNNEVIYCNLLSIDKEKIPYHYIKDLEDLLKLRSEHDIIIFFDEIFTEITKHQKISKDVMDFLSQMRKRRIILLTTCQEWRLLPLDFRLYVRYQINCSIKSFPFFNAVSIRKVIDGDNIKWSDEDQDFVGELIGNIVWHMEKSICDLYDTYEQIGTYSNYSQPTSESSAGVDENTDTDFWEEKLPLDDFIPLGESDDE